MRTVHISCRWRTSHEIEVPDGKQVRNHLDPMPDWIRDQVKAPYDDAALVDYWVYKDDTES